MRGILVSVASAWLFLLAGCSSGAGAGMGTGAPPVVAPTPGPTATPSPSPSPAPGYGSAVPPPPGHVVTPSALQPVRSAQDTLEFRRNYDANESVNALFALDTGFTGAGVTVGIIDDGAMNIAGELDDRIDLALSRDFGREIVAGQAVARNRIGDARSTHGTAIANIIAGARNGLGAAGYAPDSRLAVLRIDDWDASSQTKTYSHLISALDWARANNLKLVNISLSTGGNPLFGEAISRYARTGGLLVLAAGNQGASDPADAAAVAETARAATLFVVALGPSIYVHELAPYSNRAGSMAERTVAAPGSNMTLQADGTTGLFTGTSSAAPVVTALAATILSRWPQLSGQDAGEIILATARDIGAPGTDPVFGRGLVDFKAALLPVAPMLSNGRVSVALTRSALGLPAAFDPRALEAVLSDVTLVDRFGRDFRGSLAGLVVGTSPPPGALRTRIARIHGSLDAAVGTDALAASVSIFRPGLGVTDRPASLSHATLRYSLAGEQIEASWNGQPGAASDLAGLSAPADALLAYAPRVQMSVRYSRPFGPGQVTASFVGGGAENSGAWAGSLALNQGGTSIRLALVEERGTVLGAHAGLGGLRLGRGARTLVAEMTRSFALPGDWIISGYASLGATSIAIDRASLVTDASQLLGTRFGAQTAGPFLGGVVEVGVAQPLSIQWGSIDITRAVRFDHAVGALDHSVSRVSIAGARGVHLTAGFAAGTIRSRLRIGVLHDREDGSTSALATWRVRL
ncbi:S8 family serine peptidase [Sphingomonas sp. R647]|uniref:S8 family serine peptidase n=1 Tax=Sphingomonas sp. R647 TaxID=2875233 RepID=UPI001CD1E13D|nr:S8 family serine peptidase [Sphingomonas sp. R647]MCA1196373.1 S8 family serine peptidase [Sphingomonas sp. R647]